MKYDENFLRNVIGEFSSLANKYRNMETFNLRVETPTIPFNQFINFAMKTKHKMIGKKVEVKLSDDLTKTGTLYTIDPEDNHVVLLNSDAKKHTFDFLFAESISSIKGL